MCGIAGIFGRGIENEKIHELLFCLHHRGPDSSVVRVLNNCQLGMSRLAIVDVVENHQPYVSEDEKIICVFNGEIYNHERLRGILASKNHNFKSSHSDGEVIIHLYEEYGVDFPKHLEGIFAIAIYDLRKNILILSRDHFGVKPLYYAREENTILFASEIGALTKVMKKLQPDVQQIKYFMYDGNTKAPGTIYKEIQQILPGSTYTFDILKLTYIQNNFYQPFFETQNSNSNLANESEVAERLLELLKTSIRSQTMSDVGYGALLSGGIDSSAVATIASQFTKNTLKTYCAYYPGINNDGKNLDFKYAREISTIIGSQHYEIPITYNDFISKFDEIYRTFEEPFAGVTTNFFVSSEISKSNKVALTGDGSDEIFGSYLTHRVASIGESLDKFQTLRSEDVNFIGMPENQIREILKLKEANLIHAKVRDFAQTDIIERHLSQILKPIKIKSEIKLPETDLLNQILSIDVRDLLPNQILPFVDRLSMKHSVELRPPFLDKNLANFAFSIPGKLKIKNHSNKYILKLALKNLLPDEVIERKKEGFVMPLQIWMNGNLRHWVKKRLYDKNIENNPYVNYDALQRTLKLDYFDIKSTNLIWKILILNEWWYRTHEFK